MSKKYFMNPFVLALSDMGDDIYDGGETSHWTPDDPTDIYPVDYATWCSWHENDEDWGMYDPEEAYYGWWEASEFGEDEWGKFNPDMPWPFPG